MIKRPTGGLLIATAIILGGAGPPPAVPALPTTTTEEGQHVAFDLYTWQRRELAKRLPLDEAWPSDAEIGDAFRRFGLDKSSAPVSLPTPTRIVDDIYLVGSAPTLTYLIDCGPDGLALVDPGMVSDHQAIAAAIEKLNLGKPVRWVLNTHAHFDHSMGNLAFRKGGAKVIAGAADSDAIERATRVTAYFALPPALMADYPKSPVDHRLADGEELRLGNKTFHVIHIPGHTPGSIALGLQIDRHNILFSGDTLLYDHRLGFQGTAYASDTDYGRSLDKLARFSLERGKPFRWDVLLPGHGTIVMDRAWMDVDKGQRTLDLDLLKGRPVSALPFATPAYRREMFGRP